ncbi:ring-opening amidohydrolase [Acetobacteraceae bacterium H6797]|nr:ring-opening amidohydrolase [Acetobacteraceae bacterium H6797]
MPRLAIHRLAMAHPGDMSDLAAQISAGKIEPKAVRAIIGKTEGNGGLNDFTRGYFTQSLMALLSLHTGEAAAALAARIPCVLSGGTEGALSPHAMVFSVLDEAPPSGSRGLALGTAFSAPCPAHEIGRMAQVEAVRATVLAAMGDAGITRPEDVALVQVKAPAPQSFSPDHPPRTTDAKLAMALSRAAAALGVALALGDVPTVTEEALLADTSLYTNRASISSGIEVLANEVVVLGHADGWAPGIGIAVRPMADLLDLPAICTAFADLGFTATPSVPEAERHRILGVLAKGEPDKRGTIRGQRHTMLGDTDLDAQRHLRGALGAIVAAVAGDGRIFCSGGAEHQGPAGGGLICVLAREG